MSDRRPFAGFVTAAFLVALVLAAIVAPRASSSPDGLQKVAAEQHLDGDRAADSADSAGKGAGTIAAVIGVIVTFGVAVGMSKLVKMSRSRRAPGPSTV